MTRIYPPLALTSLVTLAATAVLGWSLGDLQTEFARLRNVETALRMRPHLAATDAEQLQLEGQRAAFDSTQRRARWHRLAGVAAALLAVLVYSIAVTYLIGTGRWCREVAETYGLPAELIARSTAIKRRSFPWAVCGMLCVVGIAALGAAADPSTGRPDTARWVTFHLAGALVGIAFLAVAFAAVYQGVFSQHELIIEILDRVRRARLERGLEV